MSAPAKASSVWTEMPFMRGPQGAQRLREWLPIQRQIREQSATRRARVLRYDWARTRLCHILGLADAWQWNGYVPPARDGDGRRNDLANRQLLVDLLREVAEADGVDTSGADAVSESDHSEAGAPA